MESFSGHFKASEKVGLVKLWGGCTRGVCSPRPNVYRLYSSDATCSLYSLFKQWNKNKHTKITSECSSILKQRRMHKEHVVKMFRLPSTFKWMIWFNQACHKPIPIYPSHKPIRPSGVNVDCPNIYTYVF